MMNPLNSYLEKFQATILAYVRFDLQRCLGSSIVSECAPSEFREPTELRSPLSLFLCDHSVINPDR